MSNVTETQSNKKRSISRKLIATGLVISAITVAAGFGTWAAFTSTTSNNGNTFSAASITITDDDAGATMFNISNMKPGDTQTKCIVVTNGGASTFGNVALTPSISGTGLQTYLDVNIDRGTGGSFSGGCGSFVEVSADIYTGFMTGMATINDGAGWTASASKTYRVTVSMPGGTANTAQGLNANFGLTWTAS